MKKKRIIFHIPNKINPNLASGSQIRPMKMLKAFANIGYEVDVVMGYVSERKKQIKKIKENIKNGIKYEFLYSESSTMPTALTEAHHLPIAPLLDFKFFKFCKKNNIKIGLFYRDIHWVFDFYKKSVPLLKRQVSTYFYKRDLVNYNKYLDALYLPSVKMHDYLPISINTSIKPLPPAIEIKDIDVSIKSKNIRYIYVGGIGGIYDLSLFTKVACSNKDNIINLCVRKNEWENCSDKYNYDNIAVHHKSPEELFEVYNNSDIAIIFVKPVEYWKFAIAVKLFEYISFLKPIIAVKGTAVGEFVETNNIGWVIEYDENGLEKLITKIHNNPELIQEKIANIKKIIHQNTWEARAKQVEKNLSK